MERILLSTRAERDLRRISGDEHLRARLREALMALASGAPDLDIKPLAGSAPWHRLRMGDYRVLYRSVAPSETETGEPAWLVARVVHRRDLERAVATLTA